MIKSSSQSQIVPNVNNSVFVNNNEDNLLNNNSEQIEISISDSVRNQMDKKYQMLNLKHFLKKSNSNSIDCNEDDKVYNLKIDSCRLILDENDSNNRYKSDKINENDDKLDNSYK